MNLDKKCSYEYCDNESTHLGFMNNPICEDCMLDDIELAREDPEDFETIGD